MSQARLVDARLPPRPLVREHVSGHGVEVYRAVLLLLVCERCGGVHQDDRWGRVLRRQRRRWRSGLFRGEGPQRLVEDLPLIVGTTNDRGNGELCPVGQVGQRVCGQGGSHGGPPLRRARGQHHPHHAPTGFREGCQQCGHIVSGIGVVDDQHHRFRQCRCGHHRRFATTGRDPAAPCRHPRGELDQKSGLAGPWMAVHVQHLITDLCPVVGPPQQLAQE
ncbi:hypothetical protein ACIBO1_19990 [Micromonospora sp. NPDC049903]|uniref:hypothetical protein n=1 Tax=Micromonospora sp. NPDC049903 TaxID=3364276 RepID=UPI0037B3A6DE